MSKKRQDGWTKDEDTMLTEIVLRHIRTGKTQLEAFKQAGDALSRTEAACGFRWNTSIRNRHLEAIDLAKTDYKQKINKNNMTIPLNEEEQKMIEFSIHTLEKVKSAIITSTNQVDESTLKRMRQLQIENEELKQEIKKYHAAWYEVNQVWNWIKTSNE